MNGDRAQLPVLPKRSRLGCLIAVVAVGLGALSPSARALIKFDDGHDEFFVTLGLGYGYDSNIFATTDGGGDTFASASLDLEYRRKAGLIGVDGTLGWNFSKFDKFGSEDFANPHARVEFTKDKGRTTGSLQLAAARESRAETEINIRTTSWNYDSNLNLKYPVIERYSLTGQLGYNLRDYLENIDLVDIRTFSAGSGLNYAFSSARDLVAGYRFRATDTTAHSESYDHSFTVGTSGKILAKLNGSARFGYQIRQSNRRDGQDDSYGDFTASVSTTWTLSRRLTFTGTLSRDFSTLATDTSVETTAANLDAQFAVKAKISLFAGIGGGYTRFLGLRGGGRSDTYFNFTAGANYTMNDHLKLALTYGYYKNWSTLPISDYDRHTLSLSVSSRW